MKFKQLNPFELKMSLNELLNKLNSVSDVQNCLSDIDLLDGQEDKTLLTKLLFKELINAKNNKIPIICFLLEHFTPREEFVKGLWKSIQNPSLPSEVKITVVNLLREYDSDWSFESCQDIENSEEILDASTKQLLNSAIINPEVQIDFMDFMASIKVEDKITLMNSLAQDFGDDELANILIPVFESNPNSAVGKEALSLLGATKSELALHVLERMLPHTTGELNQAVRKNLAILKMSGIREDNTKDFYKKILSNSVAGNFYITYPDGRGDIALIGTRITQEDRVRFISIVINIDKGIKDCFGFYDISKFECSKILERFLKDERTADISPSAFVTILNNAELLTIKKFGQDWQLPYEYVCWKNLLIDIDFEDKPIELIVKEQIPITKINEDIFVKLDEMKVSKRWFLDFDYSDEFETVIKELKVTDDLDELILKYRDSVFCEEEKSSWLKKLIISAYIKLDIGKIDEASEIYSLSQNENLLAQFYTNILRRSVYEYLMLVKYNKDLNAEHFTEEQIRSKIEYIEQKWVGQNV